MKKVLLLSVAGIMCLNAFAQSGQELTVIGTPPSTGPENISATISRDGTTAKGTALTDTLYYRSSYQAGGPYSNINFDRALPLDSGKLFGINAGNYSAFAQLYKFSGIDVTTPADTTAQIIGLFSGFFGTKSASTTKNIVFTLWKRGTNKNAISGRAKNFVYGTPQSTTLATKSVPLSAVNVGGGNATLVYFATPVTNVNYDVYAGYSVAYTWPTTLAGDTIGLINTQTAVSNSFSIETGTGDTLRSANNLVLDGSTWKSVVYDLGVGNGGDQLIYPIIKLSCPKCGLGVNSFTQGSLRFFGNYPNPVVNSTTVKYALTTRADVTITVVDINGKTVSKTVDAGVATGEHLTKLNTSNLAAGNYVYLVETSTGEGIASQFTVVK